ncbi:MAG: sensor histidine kinase [Jatrophihabitans sp.]
MDTEPIGHGIRRAEPSQDRTRPERNRSAAVQGVIQWATGTKAPALGGVLIWFVPLIIGPVIGAAGASPGWLAWPAILVASACWFGSITAAFRRRPEPLLAVGCLTVMGAIAIATVIGFGQAWSPLFILCNIGVGAALQTGWTVRAIIGVTLLCGGSEWLSTHHWDATWTTALPTFLSGISTFWFCLLLAVIGELARTREELADVAVTEERLRFSRDLHDLLGHTLSVIVVKAEVVRRLTGSDAAAEHAADIETIGRRALSEVRQAASSYRGMTVTAELARAEVALAATGIDLAVSGADTILPPPVDELFGWVLRESVTNVIRHSGGRHCIVRLACDEHTASIHVIDDGRQAMTARPGGGLGGLRERAAAAHARLQIDRATTGLTVWVRAPLDTDVVAR